MTLGSLFTPNSVEQTLRKKTTGKDIRAIQHLQIVPNSNYDKSLKYTADSAVSLEKQNPQGINKKYKTKENVKFYSDSRYQKDKITKVFIFESNVILQKTVLVLRYTYTIQIYKNTSLFCSY